MEKVLHKFVGLVRRRRRRRRRRKRRRSTMTESLCSV
jgi:hypothetical protein